MINEIFETLKADVEIEFRPDRYGTKIVLRKYENDAVRSISKLVNHVYDKEYIGLTIASMRAEILNPETRPF